MRNVMRPLRRWSAGALALALVAAGASAGAVRTTAYADWVSFSGTANNYAARMQVPVAGFPGASMTSDSRAGNVGIYSGATNWVGENTPVGLKYGSSRDREYVALRPRVDNPTGGSTTTYVFDHPTPPTGWTFALSDIDADQARVSATDASGAPVATADLGFAGAFNFCDTTPRPGVCSTSVGDVPTWDPTTATLTGNPGAVDTIGAIGWFEPTVPLKTLTVVFTRRAGFPLYSTSFAAVARTLSGTVSDVSTGAATCALDDVVVRLVGPGGEDLGTTTPDATGSYSFGQVATQPGYVVSVEPPAGCAALSPRSRTVSTAADDATADFDVRAIVPQPVSGTVTGAGAPLAGVTVTLHHPDGTTETTTTAADGTYLFDDNAVADGYFVSIDVPAGYSGPDERAPFDVDATPVTGQDFALVADPDVSGTVTGGGAGLGGVTVTLTPASGPALTTVTEADGSYVFERVPSGTYDISVAPPSGYDPAPPRSDVAVGSNDVTDQDFALTRPGALSGAVTDHDSGAPRPGIQIVVTGQAGNQTVVTDADGQFYVGDLTPGTYQVVVQVPVGSEVVGVATYTVVITEAGEVVGQRDFALDASEETTSPTVSPTATPTTGDTGDGGDSGTDGSGGTGGDGGSSVLPDTGGPGGQWLPLGVASVLAGLVLLLLSRRRPRTG